MALEKISLDSLPGPARHAIYVVLVLALAGIWYWFVQEPRSKELAGLISKNEELQIKVQQATAVNAQHEQYQRELEDMDARLAVLQTILPTEKEAPSFLKNIQEMAASSNLKINLFKPKAMVSHDFYSDWPVEVKLEGNYHGLGRFFEKMSQASRIVDVSTLSISNITNQTDPRWTLVATGTVTTYVQGSLSGQSVTEERIR